MNVAVLQLEVNEEKTKDERIAHATDILEGMHRDDKQLQLVLLPEIWGTGFSNFDNYEEESEELKGRTYSAFAPLAAKLGCYILTGSFVEREGSDLFNTSLLIDPEGNIVARYRKIHLFGYKSRETEVLTPGKDITVVRTEFGIWGITTCYDLRFPELYRAMVDKGAEGFLVPAAWPINRLDHWSVFNKARAIENQCYLISCNCAGSHGGVTFGGHSMVVDPWGIAVASGGDKETVVWANIDLEEVKKSRRTFTALKDRVL
ncbi:MAG: carbon-nitrogen family hydrolase [Bacillota bacterium]|nr:carbon-nitrogen family hydrolase [Bacillota bacterium]MDD3297355.1 carbon-nitrogen family hydrolase [Bacillota bacterium]MDD3850998.1 carbon-nitrogen family hydrolase [Bacillota bacterium]MDD4707140.1 carbon-nitrogen family hydrolase [Bacillota bacterium]